MLLARYDIAANDICRFVDISGKNIVSFEYTLDTRTCLDRLYAFSFACIVLFSVLCIYFRVLTV
jgi:hypothetical protein